MSEGQAQGYQVLARKYRPQSFADLIGQEAMVRTLRNAFEADRIAQAFMMTGIRGTGKTTTARIIAKGINCVGPDGTGGPTTEPCGVCEPCTAIAEGRHVDVIEMDAASNTGVGDVREIIDSVHYRAASARYKVYIIDEVHMLSTSAFNALLKTLEEPPAHVKFIFATTEIRKVPVTVLSRCQRFDLRRIEPEVMIAHLRGIAEKEGASLTDEAYALIARAAEGSVRDAVSLLDQAIGHGQGKTDGAQVRAMLGLADRARTLDLFEAVMRGDAPGALNELATQYADGADPVAVLRDLAEITHWISLVQITPEALEDPAISPDERARGTDLAGRLPMRVLTRMWQMLLKALEEVSVAPNAMMAAEMAVIRLTHVADLPSPEELVRQLRDSPPPPGPPAGHTRQGRAQGPSASAPAPSPAAAPAPSGGGTAPRAMAAEAAPAPALAGYATFDSVVALVRAKDMALFLELERHLRLIAYQPGRITLALEGADARRDFPQRLGQALKLWTHARWAVVVEAEGGAPTLAETEARARDTKRAEAEAHPLVAAALSRFPEARIVELRPKANLEAEAALEALPEVDEEWDPFEED